jgi:hypothetical protein
MMVLCETFRTRIVGGAESRRRERPSLIDLTALHLEMASYFPVAFPEGIKTSKFF